MKTTRQKPIAPEASGGEFNEAELLASVAGFVETLKGGKAHTLRSTTVNLLEPLPKRSGAEIRAVREKVGASQAVFAAWLNLPKRTLESWENNQRTPSGAALKLLDLVAVFPELFVGEAHRMRRWLDQVASGDYKGSVSAAEPQGDPAAGCQRIGES